MVYLVAVLFGPATRSPEALASGDPPATVGLRRPGANIGLDPIVPARSGFLICSRLSSLLAPSLFQELRHSECLGPCQNKMRRDQQRCPGRHFRLGVVCYMPLVEETRGQKAALVSGLFVTVLRASLNAWLLQRYSIVTEVDSRAQPPGRNQGKSSLFYWSYFSHDISGNSRQAENQGYSSCLGEFVPKPKQAVVSPTPGGKGWWR